MTNGGRPGSEALFKAVMCNVGQRPERLGYEIRREGFTEAEEAW